MEYLRADVYRNLNRRCVSIRVAGLVKASPAYAVVDHPVFRVQPGTLATCRAKGVRAVCAYARGTASTVDDIDAVKNHPDAQRLHFNPFRADTFTLDDGTPVYAAETMAMDFTSAYVIGPVTTQD